MRGSWSVNQFLEGSTVLSHFLLSLVVAALLIQVAVFSTTIYLHRCATHKALLVHPAVEWMFKMALWLTTGQCTKEWVAVHRKHHAFTDEEGDPHSPKIEGFWNVQLGNVYYYVREIKKTDVVARYARDIKDGWSDKYMFNHGLLGLGIGTALLCLIIGPVIGVGWALLAAGIHAVMYVFGLFLVLTGVRLAFAGHAAPEPEKSGLFRLFGATATTTSSNIFTARAMRSR